jgi:hypothetical protein
MAFEGLDVNISGSSGDAKAAIASVRTSLGSLTREANDAQDSLEEMNDEATDSTTRLSALAATAGASALSVSGLTSATTGATGSLTALAVSTGTVTAALVGLSAVAAPLVATLGTAAAAAGGLATAFGAVVGSGLLAFGKQQAETMEDASTATEALAQTAADLKAEIAPLVVELGESFVPLIEDAVDAIPTLAEDIIEALGPLDEFASTLADFGELAMDAIPAVVEAFVDLGRRALPFLEDLVGALEDDAAGAFEAMVDVTEVVGDDLLAIADAAGDLIPELTELGTAIIEGVAPGVEELIDGFGGLLDHINELLSGQQASEAFDAIDREIRPLIPRIVSLGRELSPVITTLVDNLPEIIRGFGAFSDSVLDIAEVAVPPLATALEKLIDLIGFLSDSYADWVAASERSEKRLNSDITSIRQAFGTAVDSVRDAWTYLTGSGSDTLRADVINQLSQLRSWLSTSWDLYPLSDTFEAAIATITGDGDSGGIVQTLKADVKETLSQLRSWLSNDWDLHPLSDAFDAAVSAIGDAFGRLDFGPLETALDAVANGVQTLIDSLNELSGVNIDVDVPSFDGLLDRAEDIVAPEPEPEPEPEPDPPDDDDDPSTGVGSGIGGSIPGAPSDDDDDNSYDPGDGASGGIGNPGYGTGLATGGFVEGDGMAMLHEGERVLPESQVTDRGGLDIGDAGGVTINIDSIAASGRAEGRAAGRALKRELKRFDI